MIRKNKLAAVPNKKKLGVALSKLKYLVIMDPLQTETAEFWKNYGEYNDVDPAQIKTTVLPAVHLLCRGRRFAGQLRSLVAVALERRRGPGRSHHRW